MKRFLILSLLLLFLPKAFTQVPQKVDSLLKALEIEKEDSTLLKINREIGNYYLDNNPSKAIEYLTKAIELGKKTNNKLRLANAYYDLGFCYLLKGDFDLSLEQYQNSIKIYESLKDKRREVNALMSIGNVFFQSKNIAKSKEYYGKAEDILKITKDSGQLSTVYAERGLMADQAKQYDSAIYYLEKAKTIATLIGNEAMINNSLSNIGLTYKHLHQTDLALQYFDSTLINYRKDPETPLDYIAALYNNIGATHAQAGNYTKALEAFNKSNSYAINAHISGIELENYRNMADMFGAQKDYRQENIYLKKYYNLKDSIYNSESKNKLTQLEADFQLEKKNGILVKQEAASLRHKNQRNIFLVAAIAALALLTALAFLYRQIKQKNLLLQLKNEEIQQQKEALQNLNQVKDRLFSIISHDLRNPLVTLQSYLTLAESRELSADKKIQFKQQTFQAVSQTTNMLDNLLTWANMQLKNTRPNITSINLQDCVEDTIEAVLPQAKQKNIDLIQNIKTTTAIADYTVIEIALRNILTNAIKFSNSNGKITVSTYIKDQHTCIAIQDEGIGLTAEQIHQLLQKQIDSSTGTAGEKGTGLGLFLVQELLQKMNATLQIESEPGKGSCFTMLLQK